MPWPVGSCPPWPHELETTTGRSLPAKNGLSCNNPGLVSATNRWELGFLYGMPPSALIGRHGRFAFLQKPPRHRYDGKFRLPRVSEAFSEQFYMAQPHAHISSCVVCQRGLYLY